MGESHLASKDHYRKAPRRLRGYSDVAVLAPVGVPCRPMKVGIPKEIYPHELRVAATPDTVEKMVKLGLEVAVETGAGDAASFSDAAYAEAGAQIMDGPRSTPRPTSS